MGPTVQYRYGPSFDAWPTDNQIRATSTVVQIQSFRSSIPCVNFNVSLLSNMTGLAQSALLCYTSGAVEREAPGSFIILLLLSYLEGHACFGVP